MFGFLILSIPLFLETLDKLLDKKRILGGRDMKTNVWCELDTNLLGEIMGRLCLTDQARFRGVCNNWRAARPITGTKSLPWYFCFDRSLPTVSKRLEFRVYDPSSVPNVALVHSIPLNKLGFPSPCSYEDIAVYVKYNWLLICCARPRLSRRDRFFALISPFTKRIITLPLLDHPCLFKFIPTFTAKPDSPNCVFFLLHTRQHTSQPCKLLVITYRNGDIAWTAREFDTVVEFLPCISIPVYVGGIMYIVSPYGQLASYNIIDDEIKFESLFVDELFRLNYISSRMCRVFELNGELMLIYFGSHLKDNTTSLGKQCIKLYDWSNKFWIPVSTLGDNALFVNDGLFQVTTVNGEELGINGILSNKVYRFSDCGCLIYSIEDGELVEYKSIKSNLLEDGVGILPNYKFGCNISFADKTKSRYWLDPPVLTTEKI